MIPALPSQMSRHIIFDDWSLVDNGIARDPTYEEGLRLIKLFPTQTSVFVHVFVLVCYVTHLPPKPWPITVAGLPVFISDNKDELPFDFGKVGWGEHALQQLDARSGLTHEIINSIFEHLAQILEPGILTAITWSEEILFVEYKGDVLNTKRLPRTIASLRIGYVRAKINSIEHDGALKNVQPSISYTNQTFQNSINNQAPTLASFRGANADEKDCLRRYDTLYMDSPHSGILEGVYLGMRLDVIPSDEPGHPVRWVTSSWTWFEDLSSAPTIADGLSGSIIWDSEGRVVSLLRFHGQAAGGRNCILGAAAVELRDFGIRWWLCSSASDPRK